MNIHSSRSAFTMIELIFVIVILGIISSIGAELIANTYQNYAHQRARHRASLETELAAIQIANRLAGAIPGTAIRRIGQAGASENVNEPMLLDPSGNAYDILQWVGADIDSFNAAATPGWSGFCDVDASAATSLETPGSDLISTTTPIVTNLSGAAPAAGGLAVFFPEDANAYGATITDADTIGITAATTIQEHYKLAWTSYALEVNGANQLILHYNFAPTRAAALPGGRTSILMEDVVTFKFMGSGRTIRFKICKDEDIGEVDNIVVCKEKAVF